MEPWYGRGSALEALHGERPDQFAQLSEFLLEWAPLRYVLSNATTCVEEAHLDIMVSTRHSWRIRCCGSGAACVPQAASVRRLTGCRTCC